MSMRILFVTLPKSPHSARHINMVAEHGWDVHVFPSYRSELLPEFSSRITVHEPPMPVPVPTEHPAGLARKAKDRVSLAVLRTGRRLMGLATAGPPRVPGLATVASIPPDQSVAAELPPFPTSTDLPLSSLLDSVVVGSTERSRHLAALVKKLRPDVIHSHTIQQASHLTLAAKMMVGDEFPAWVVGNWGLDIHFFGRHPFYAQGIRAVLSQCDYYTAECCRDVALARKFGFKGEVLGVAPIGGGFDLGRVRGLRQQGPSSSRRLIMLKGYQDLVGRALVGLRAIELCADVLHGYRVAVYLAHPDVELAARLLSQSTGIPIEIVPRVPYEQIMRLHGQARVSLGLSMSDGISTSALEALTMGSFPIQSNTSCLGEWIKDGETGSLVPAEDPEVVAAALRRAVTDDALVDRASEHNLRLAEDRLDQSAVEPPVIAMYERLERTLRARSTSFGKRAQA
jgi:glycosyltransferase involved in cell wall biosynthesis